MLSHAASGKASLICMDSERKKRFEPCWFNQSFSDTYSAQAVLGLEMAMELLGKDMEIIKHVSQASWLGQSQSRLHLDFCIMKDNVGWQHLSQIKHILFEWVKNYIYLSGVTGFAQWIFSTSCEFSGVPCFFIHEVFIEMHRLGWTVPGIQFLGPPDPGVLEQNVSWNLSGVVVVLHAKI